MSASPGFSRLHICEHINMLAPQTESEDKELITFAFIKIIGPKLNADKPGKHGWRI